MAERHERPSGGQIANLVVALACHVVFGLPWTFAVIGVALIFSETWGVAWGVCGLVLWGLGAYDAVRRAADWA